MASPLTHRQIFDAVRPLQNDLALALGFDLQYADLNTRIIARSSLGVQTIPVWALLESGGLTVAQLQNSIAVARNPAINTWPPEPEFVPFPN